ncbi:DUF1877 family protein [Streptomyces sp. PTD5-9]|uniref:DUF1877 family protein n=1 Tax=Streptomyces sp. PTD5-9 TaxID=3120150 RepID=UPI00300A2B3B
MATSASAPAADHLPADRVRLAAEALSGLTYDRLLDGVDPRDLTAAEIYPPGWEEPGALDWARDWFTGLTAYFEAAARERPRGRRLAGVIRRRPRRRCHADRVAVTT